MDPVRGPHDWWARGGYDEVIRHTGWSRARSRRDVKNAIRSYGWSPIGHAGHEALRQRVINGDMTERDLV